MTIAEMSSQASMNILAVEDEENVRNLYGAVLSEEGHKVATASNGTEAIEKISKQQFDFYILDLKLPDMQGTDVLKKIKEGNENAVVIIVTAFPSLETSIEAIKVGVYDYIIKPFSPKQLRLVVKRAVEKIQLTREKDRLLKKLEERNKRLEDSANELENIANVAMAREREMAERIKELEKEIMRLKETKK